MDRAKQQPAANPTSELAEFVSGMAYDDVPSEGIRLAERCFVDTIGVTLAGSTEGAGATAAKFLTTNGSVGQGRARVLGQEMDNSTTDAAFVNGTAGHGLDFDDVGPGMSGHPSVTMVSPLLAVADAEPTDGRELLQAFVAGFEAQSYLAAPITPGHYEAGWHATSTFGTFGAAAAAASLLGLDPSETRHALNIAASMPAGLKRNFGSMTKPMHAGQAARSGVTATLLAREGFTAETDAIGGDGGFYDLYAGTHGIDWEAFYSLGDRWALLDDGVHVKKYPCCYFTHTSIAAARELVEEDDIAPESIELVTVSPSRGAIDALPHANPTTGLEGKFSMHYTVASALVRDRIDLATFDDERIDDPDVQRVRERVTCDADPDLPYDSHEATVTIETSERTFARTFEKPPGTHDNPLPDEELRDKFLMCATRAVDEETAEMVYEWLDTLRDRDVDDVTQMLKAL